MSTSFPEAAEHPDVLNDLVEAIVGKTSTTEFMRRVRSIIQAPLQAVGFETLELLPPGFMAAERPSRAHRLSARNFILWNWPIRDAHSGRTLKIVLRLDVSNVGRLEQTWSLDICAMAMAPPEQGIVPLALATLETTPRRGSETPWLLETQYTDLSETGLPPKEGNLQSLAENFAAQLTRELSA